MVHIIMTKTIKDGERQLRTSGGTATGVTGPLFVDVVGLAAYFWKASCDDQVRSQEFDIGSKRGYEDGILSAVCSQYSEKVKLPRQLSPTEQPLVLP